MVRLNPFCDDDIRHGLQFFSGVNLILYGMSIVIDVVVISEISHFYIYWDHTKLKISPSTADLLLMLDILLITLQIFYSLKLFHAVSENAYSKIRNWEKPSMLLLWIRSVVIFAYIMTMPVSSYYAYFTSIAVLYAAFMFWPVRRFLAEFGNLPTTENTRLLGCVN